jgi:serine/threonine protein kinase
MMNIGDGNAQGPNLGKTFVEGDDAKTGVHSLGVKERLDATSIRGANPYGQPGAANLPTGNEPLVLGSGTIVGLLGSGGMARVYKIWNDKLEVFRAVKILIPNQQGDVRNRFETEAKITAKLHHPNIVEVYNVGDWQTLPYLEMELIDGQSLESIIHTTGKLPPSVCSAIAVFIIRALSYAHGQEFLIYGKTYQGIIHRDLKPANIMVSLHGELKLMDFGIARPTEASLHTVEGNIVGTMQYLSPEQLDGVDVDSRADIYSFGAILYEILTGTKTFPQETITNLMKQKITNEYRKFNDFDFTIPSGLAKIALKCLQLSKESRFASAAILLKELENVHRSLTSDSPESVLKAFIADPSSIKSAERKKNSSRIGLKILIPAAGMLIVGALVAVFVLTGPKPEQTAPPVAVKAPQQAPAPQQPSAPSPPPAQPPENNALQPLAQDNAVQKNVINRAPAPASTPLTSHTVRPIRQRGQRPAPVTAQETNSIPEPVKPDLPPLERLKTAYGSGDYFTIGKLASQKNDFSDAILALTSVPASDPNHEKASILLLDAYIEGGRIQDAQSLAQNEINDAEYFFLRGKLAQKQGRNKEALNHFQTALTKPCIVRSIGEVRMDALYYTALASQVMYVSDPSADNKSLALQAWLVVKNTYRNNPNHARFKKAVEEMASIK